MSDKDNVDKVQVDFFLFNHLFWFLDRFRLFDWFFYRFWFGLFLFDFWFGFGLRWLLFSRRLLLIRGLTLKNQAYIQALKIRNISFKILVF